ncbi:hypothetical protein K2173_014492 [Erythroxylum novogranatense]|uniref:Uncharacterized protein n=1 Tax=Erythroxylum novogranatense TaxID=1862640 RepID=A0AAV8S5E6_9ROSI|nr:hypothetical protein K2173_014492 [Erythroxylum novogranatense]
MGGVTTISKGRKSAGGAETHFQLNHLEDQRPIWSNASGDPRGKVDLTKGDKGQGGATGDNELMIAGDCGAKGNRGGHPFFNPNPDLTKTAQTNGETTEASSTKIHGSSTVASMELDSATTDDSGLAIQVVEAFHALLHEVAQRAKPEDDVSGVSKTSRSAPTAGAWSKQFQFQQHKIQMKHYLDVTKDDIVLPLNSFKQGKAWSNTGILLEQMSCIFNN